MFTVKLVSYHHNEGVPESTHVFQTERYRVEPNINNPLSDAVHDDKSEWRLQALDEVDDLKETYLISHKIHNYNVAFVMNDNGKTVQVVRSYP